MKSFDDFLMSLTEEDLSKIIDNAGEKAIFFAENSSDSRTRLGNQVGAVSYYISIGLLRKYHEWISQEQH